MNGDTDTHAPACTDWPLGAHLVTPRLGYTHHGIYVGNGRVVHYAGLSRAWWRGPVEEVSLARFAGGRPITMRTAGTARYAGADIAARARSRLGEDRYRLVSNNCEHFCAWCVSGESFSEQIESLRRTVSTLSRRIGDLFGRGLKAPRTTDRLAGAVLD